MIRLSQYSSQQVPGTASSSDSSPRGLRWKSFPEMAPHSSTLAWKIPWTEEPGRLQSMGSLRVRHDRATSLSLFTFMHWRRKWQPVSVFLPGKSQGRGNLMGCSHGVAQSRTQLKRLSSSQQQRHCTCWFL